MKLVSAHVHGFADFAVVAACLAAPRVLDFEGSLMLLSYAMGGIHLTLAMLTDFPLGATKIIPFKLHGYLEVAFAPLVGALPWVMSFENNPNGVYFCLGFGAVLFAAFLITDYNDVSRTAAEPDESLRRAG